MSRQPYLSINLNTGVAHIMQYPMLQNLRSFSLATSDVHGLYENYGGFESLEGSDFNMKRTAK